MTGLIIREEVCWLALAVCILTEITPEESFQRIAPVGMTGGKNIRLTEDVIREMVRLKKSMSYEALGKYYGVSANTAYRNIKKYNERVKVDDRGKA